MSGGALRAGAAAMNGQERKDAEDEKDDAPWLPLLDKKNLKEFIIPLSTAAFLGITAMNVLSSNLGQDPLAKDAKHKVLRQILVPMPYAMFSLGIAGLTAAMGATRRPGLLGCATGFLLVELVFLVVVGALVSIVHTEGGNKIVWPVTAGIIFALMVIWPMMCAYPQWLRRAFEFITCCCCSKAESPTDTQDKCKTCGGFVVGGKSPNPAAEGAQPCATCGGDANNPRSAPSNAGTASPPHESKIVDAKNPATAPHGSNIV